MASSFVEYREKGFWARDGKLEVWLHLLVCEIDKLDSLPSWLLNLREHWEFQTAGNCSGFMSAKLDEFVTDDERREQILLLSERALQRLDAYGEVISAGELNSMGVGGKSSTFMCDLSPDKFKVIGRAFIQLLRGELDTDASTSPVL